MTDDDKPDPFALMCEHMAATLSMLPRKATPIFDKVTVMSSLLIGASTGEDILDPSGGDGPTPYDLSRPVRYGTIADMHADDNPNRRTGFHAMKAHTASRMELRRAAGRLPFLSPFPHLAVAVAFLKPYTRTTTHGQFMASYHAGDRSWVKWGNGYRTEVDPNLHEQLEMLISLQFSSRYNWHVHFRIGDGPRLSLVTKPEHARHLFKARDLPPGKERRAALRHWVSEHYRRPDTITPIGVRSHFRGADSFDWSGLRCEIEPSEYDKDRVGDKP